ncbi:MAG: hypothetical protein H8E66_19615 [Planctomycetes bacterium]|nr:hypothetical protein [Planctomycetota bacterium]
MAKFKFPRNPNADRENPFENGEGANPFGDDSGAVDSDGESESSPEQNFYATAEKSAIESSSVQPYRPDDYETFLPSRGSLVWWLGMVGCCVQLLAIAVAVIAIVAIGDFLEGLAYGLPGQLIGIAISVPAWVMGQSDSRAIAAGAMEEGGRRATKWGHWLGALGTLLGASQLLLYASLFIFEEFFA